MENVSDGAPNIGLIIGCIVGGIAVSICIAAGVVKSLRLSGKASANRGIAAPTTAWAQAVPGPAQQTIAQSTLPVATPIHKTLRPVAVEHHLELTRKPNVHEKANLANLTTKQLRGMLPRRFF
jgi:hypothetical protein